ncbi:lipase member H-B-like [Spodoptera litura]|uniref:Lipase member H-B-like n=1 Tax=Spodoptera litura TaxID=69820 RepID=A0A9J7EKU1_SPOLT|nr:lipase member H-B-like [Spodoptera litura]
MNVVVLLYLCSLVLAEDTGQPAGLMADCPGMNKSTLLSEKTKKSLSVIVVYPSSGFLGHRETRCSLSAEGAACAAKHIPINDLKKRKTLVMISGYMDSTFSPVVRTLLAMYLGLGRNVIVLEIFPILVRSYPIAARITKPLGNLLGEFLASLTSRGLSSKKLELVGGSLGAHIASYAADTYKLLTGRRPARLTGLDPAGPCFRNVPPTSRLHAGAADRVDVLHTNIDGFGIPDRLGHVDFYANGGEYQPYLKGDFIMPCFQLCSHVRSVFYWYLSYSNPDKFIAVQCDSVADARHGNCYEGTLRTNALGPNTNFSKTGVFYLPTNAKSPYYLGLNGLKKRKYGVNDYLMTPAPDEDITI